MICCPRVWSNECLYSTTVRAVLAAPNSGAPIPRRWACSSTWVARSGPERAVLRGTWRARSSGGRSRRISPIRGFAPRSLPFVDLASLASSAWATRVLGGRGSSPGGSSFLGRCMPDGLRAKALLFPGKRITVAYRVQDATRSEPSQAPGRRTRCVQAGKGVGP